MAAQRLRLIVNKTYNHGSQTIQKAKFGDFCHACHLQGLPDLWLDRGSGDHPEDDHGLPLSELQGGMACGAGCRAVSGLEAADQSFVFAFGCVDTSRAARDNSRGAVRSGPPFQRDPAADP
jgi:hypothetical protein